MITHMAAPTSAALPAPAALYRPPGPLDLATALEPYAGPWGVRQAAHLYRRAGFGGSPDDVARATSAGMRASVDRFIRFADASGIELYEGDVAAFDCRSGTFTLADGLPESIGAIKAGTVRALAVTTAARSPTLSTKPRSQSSRT